MKRIFHLLLIFTISSCSILNTSEIIDQKKRVVIVGAGVSGLSAAQYLKDHNCKAVLLEAQSEIGGRIKTDTIHGLAYDLGASWIHGKDNNPIVNLAKSAGASTYVTDDFSIKVYDINGSVYSSQLLKEEEAEYNKIINRLKGNYKQDFGSVFYEDFPEYKGNRLWTYMLSAFLEFDTGGDIYRLSSKSFYDDEEFEGRDVIVTNGYNRISNYLAKDLDIRLNKKVTSIDYSDNQILIKTNDGEYIADMVLVTVPLGVLKKNVIQFVPKLPQNKQSAIDNMEMGQVNKFFLLWDSCFWDSDVQYIGYTPMEKGKFNYFLNVNTFSNSNALITYAFGDYSIQTEKMTNQQVVDEIMTHLRSIYGNEIPEPIKMFRTKWNENQYSFGAYSFSSKGLYGGAFEVFEDPIEDKIFFAGEHTSIDYRGTVHGAYLSGIREARKILRTKRVIKGE